MGMLDTTTAQDWSVLPLADLVQHLLDRHHSFTREQTARLEPLIENVCAEHERTHPELATLRGHFEALQADLEQHMAKEELILFPHIRGLDAALQKGVRGPGSGSVRQAIRVIEMEHEIAFELLHRIRETTADYTPPTDASREYRALYEALILLECDLRIHFHLESDMLFPRAIAAEADLY